MLKKIYHLYQLWKRKKDCFSIGNKKLIEDQQNIIDKLMKRIGTLEGKFYDLEGRLLVIQTVNRHLDSHAQYSRWYDWW